MYNSSAKVYNLWHSSTSSNTGNTPYTAVAFNGLQLQTAVVDSRSRDSWHKEVIKCFCFLFFFLAYRNISSCSIARQLELFYHAATQKPWLSTTNSAHSCAYSAPKYVGHLKAAVQNKTVRDNEPTRTHSVKETLRHKAAKPIFYRNLQNSNIREGFRRNGTVLSSVLSVTISWLKR
jgi:hypothetical protein